MAVFRRNYQPVHPKYILALGLILLQDNTRNSRQSFVIQAPMSLAQCFKFFSPFCLGKTNGGMNVTHAVIKADIGMQIGTGSVQRETEILVIATGRGQSIIVGNDHPAFAARHIFISKKAKACNT